jgi:hypothetical protein
LLARRHVTGASAQVEHVFEPTGELVDRHDACARGNQLDGERQPVKTPAESSDRLRVRLVDGKAVPDGRSAAGEQLDGLGLEDRGQPGVWIGHRQRRDGNCLLAREPQRHPAGHEQPEPRCRRHQVPDLRGEFDDRLEVVQDQERGAVEQLRGDRRVRRLRRHAWQPQGGRDRRHETVRRRGERRSPLRR